MSISDDQAQLDEDSLSYTPTCDWTPVTFLKDFSNRSQEKALKNETEADVLKCVSNLCEEEVLQNETESSHHEEGKRNM